MSKEADKEAKQKLDRWLEEIVAPKDKDCEDYCELVKEQNKDG